MGLVLSLLVVAVGVIEALSCYHHFQIGLIRFRPNPSDDCRRRSLFPSFRRQREKNPTTHILVEEPARSLTVEEQKRIEKVARSLELHLLQLQQQQLQLQLNLAKVKEVKEKERAKQEEKQRLVERYLGSSTEIIRRSISLPEQPVLRKPYAPDEHSKTIDELTQGVGDVTNEFEKLYEETIRELRQHKKLAEKRHSVTDTALPTENVVELASPAVFSVSPTQKLNESDLSTPSPSSHNSDEKTIVKNYLVDLVMGNGGRLEVVLTEAKGHGGAPVINSSADEGGRNCYSLLDNPVDAQTLSRESLLVDNVQSTSESSSKTTKGEEACDNFDSEVLAKSVEPEVSFNIEQQFGILNNSRAESPISEDNCIVSQSRRDENVNCGALVEKIKKIEEVICSDISGNAAKTLEETSELGSNNENGIYSNSTMKVSSSLENEGESGESLYDMKSSTNTTAEKLKDVCSNGNEVEVVFSNGLIETNVSIVTDGKEAEEKPLHPSLIDDDSLEKNNCNNPLLPEPSLGGSGDENSKEIATKFCPEDEIPPKDLTLTSPSTISSELKESTKEPFWLIFSGEYTKAMSKDWHSGHFSCWQCDEPLTGQRYVLRDDHPYCIKCYESVFANSCEECNKIIGIDSKDLSYKDKHWHEACFLCNKCRVSLVDKQFGSKADKIYCGNCYDAQFASRCDGCGEIFRAGDDEIKKAKDRGEDVAVLSTALPFEAASKSELFNCALGGKCMLGDPRRIYAGTKKMEYKTRQWHEKCFCCCVCKTAIGTKSFIPREQEIYCSTCYEEKFATRCVKCNKIITSGGVTYKNEPWHRDCFTCTNCNTSLAGQRFTSRDEKPYCAECFGELFAKRCTSCSRPITGIGGTRFISFEDRHWHNDCFICAACQTSLVGRGFITDADDIICPECAKQRLM